MRKGFRKYGIASLVVLLVGLAVCWSCIVLASELDKVSVSATPSFENPPEPALVLENSVGDCPKSLVGVLPYVFVAIGIFIALATISMGDFLTGILTTGVVVILTTTGTGLIQNLLEITL